MCLFKWPFIYSVIHNSTAQFAGCREALGAGAGQCVDHFIIIKENKHIMENDGGKLFCLKIVIYHVLFIIPFSNSVAARHRELRMHVESAQPYIIAAGCPWWPQAKVDY